MSSSPLHISIYDEESQETFQAAMEDVAELHGMTVNRGRGRSGPNQLTRAEAVVEIIALARDAGLLDVGERQDAAETQEVRS